MKSLKLLFLVLTLFITLAVACSLPNKYEKIDLHGWILEIDEANERILIRDSEWNETWIDVSKLRDQESFLLKSEVIVWLKDDSSQVPVAKDIENPK